MDSYFIDGGGAQRKALLSLLELRKGYTSADCARQIVEASQSYQIIHQHGAVTNDNTLAMGHNRLWA